MITGDTVELATQLSNVIKIRYVEANRKKTESQKRINYVEKDI